MPAVKLVHLNKRPNKRKRFNAWHRVANKERSDFLCKFRKEDIRELERMLWNAFNVGYDFCYGSYIGEGRHLNSELQTEEQVKEFKQELIKRYDNN